MTGKRKEPQSASQYIRAEDAADILDVSASTVYNMAREDRDFPALRVRGMLRIPRKEFMDYLATRTQHASTPTSKHHTAA
jgi:excisionase family DNA binding protein